MRWNRVDNPDVIDARGGGGGGIGGRAVAIPGGMGLVGVILFIAIQLLTGGGGPTFDVNNQLQPGGPAEAQPIPADQDPERDRKEFSTYVFTDVQKMWRGVFEKAGRPYDRAQMVLYRQGVSSGCGNASSAVGPFYCPADKRVYIDLSFMDAMQGQLGAGGDFAWAYVIAHEMGHHIQQQLGTEAEVRDQMRSNPDQQNELSVRLELQADCYAGVWAHSAQSQLEDGDIEEGINAASAVGDDTLQRRSGGGVNPDSFTHGTSEQRMRWFKTGYDAGDPGRCNTFATADL